MLLLFSKYYANQCEHKLQHLLVKDFRFVGGNGAVLDSVCYVYNIEIWKDIPSGI